MAKRGASSLLLMLSFDWYQSHGVLKSFERLEYFLWKSQTLTLCPKPPLGVNIQFGGILWPNHHNVELKTGFVGEPIHENYDLTTGAAIAAVFMLCLRQIFQF